MDHVHGLCLVRQLILRSGKGCCAVPDGSVGLELELHVWHGGKEERKKEEREDGPGIVLYGKGVTWGTANVYTG